MEAATNGRGMLGQGQVGGELAAAEAHRLAGAVGPAVQGDRVAGHLVGMAFAHPWPDGHPGAGQRRGELANPRLAAAAALTLPRSTSRGGVRPARSAVTASLTPGQVWPGVLVAPALVVEVAQQAVGAPAAKHPPDHAGPVPPTPVTPVAGAPARPRPPPGPPTDRRHRPPRPARPRSSLPRPRPWPPACCTPPRSARPRSGHQSASSRRPRWRSRRPEAARGCFGIHSAGTGIPSRASFHGRERGRCR